jgi:hypothetical protein
MAAVSTMGPSLQKPDRRSFLWSLAGLGVTAKTRISEEPGESLYRLLTPECEVRMTVQYFANPSTSSFRFRDDQTNRRFCLSADGGKDQACLDRFVGSMAIAHYDFRSRLHSKTPLTLRERVLTIDHDSRLSARPPFERVLAVERKVVSDIQAFGYNVDDPQQEPPGAGPLAVWCLLRQDLYLNDQTTAFLIVHWKHTLDFISLLDVIPGDGTELIEKGHEPR